MSAGSIVTIAFSTNILMLAYTDIRSHSYSSYDPHMEKDPISSESSHVNVAACTNKADFSAESTQFDAYAFTHIAAFKLELEKRYTCSQTFFVFNIFYFSVQSNFI